MEDPHPKSQGDPLDGDDPSLATRTVRVAPGPRRLALVERVLTLSREDILEPVLHGRHAILAGMGARLVTRRDSDDELVDLTLWKGRLEVVRLAYNINASKHRTWMIDIHPGFPVANLDPLIARLADRLEQLRDLRLAKRAARLRSEAGEISTILQDLGMGPSTLREEAEPRRGRVRASAAGAGHPDVEDHGGPR